MQEMDPDSQKNDSAYLVQRAVRLISNEVSKNSYDCHYEYTKSYVEVCRKGVYITDLFYCSELLQQLSERVEEVPLYHELMEDLLEICQIPPRLTKSSDVLTFSADLEHYFNILGIVATNVSNDLKPKVMDVLMNLVERKYEEKVYTPLRVRIKAMEDSKLTGIFAEILLLVNEDFYVLLLKMIALMTSMSTQCCKTLLSGDVLNTIFLRFNPRWSQEMLIGSGEDPIVGGYLEMPCENHDIKNCAKCDTKPVEQILHYEAGSSLAWTLLQCLDRNREMLEDVPVISKRSLKSIRIAFRCFTRCLYQKLERNNILAIILVLVDLFPTMDFVSSGLAADVIKISMWSMNFLNLEGKSSSSIKLTGKEIDYICLKLALSIFTYYPRYDGGILLMDDASLTFRLLKTIRKDKNSIIWPSTYACVIVIFTWNLLKQILPHQIERFCDCGGPHIILNCVKVYDTTIENLTLLEKCLNTLNCVLCIDSDNMIKNFIEEEGFRVFLELATKLMNAKPSNSVQKCLQLCLSILAKLNPGKSKSSMDIMELSKTLIEKVLRPPPEEFTYNNRSIVWLIDLVSQCVVDSAQFSEEFVKAGCVYQLLDMLEVFPFIVQLIILKLITDLLEDGHCVPYLVTWTGKSGITLIPLLLKIFRYENKMLKVKSQLKGQIEDPKYPLMGKQQWIETYCHQNRTKSHPCITDMILSSRPKIYAILTMLQERHKDKVELCRDSYKFDDGLDAEDIVTMLLAENYLGLKLGEAWRELKTEFKNIKFIPNAVDKEMVLKLNLRTFRWAAHLKALQEAVLRKQTLTEKTKEADLYTTLTDARLSQALESLTELKYFAHCTEKMFRVQKKYRVLAQVERSRQETQSMQVQKTYDLNSDISVIFNQIVTMKSDMIKKYQEVIEPVSEEDSDDESIVIGAKVS